MKVLFAPQVEDDLFNLVEILVQKGYLGTYEFAISYVEELVDYIQTHIHIGLKKKAPTFFNQYKCDYGTFLIAKMQTQPGIFSFLK